MSKLNFINMKIANLLRLGFVAAAAFLVGCATPASQMAMSLDHTDILVKPSEKLKGQVYVRSVKGGKETNPAWISQVDTQSFKGALERSLNAVGYGSDLPTAKYTIDTEIQDIKQPSFGLTFNVESIVFYTVETSSDSKKLPITAVGSASASDTLVGVERMKIANERSVKENIRSFIDRLTSQYGK
jgi:hypothetical protein